MWKVRTPLSGTMAADPIPTALDKLTPEQRKRVEFRTITHESKPQPVGVGTTHLQHSNIDEIGPAFSSEGSTFIPLAHGLKWDVLTHQGHALSFGRTRCGKGVSVINPALLSYRGSMLVIDPKGESAWVTGPRRASFGRVVVLDPWNEVTRRYGSKVGVSETTTRFNPLSALNPSEPEFADEVAALADALIIPESGGNNRHFSDSARELVAGLIAAVIEKAPDHASLRDVRTLLLADTGTFTQAVGNLVAANPDGLGAKKLQRFSRDSDEISSIKSTALTQTGFLDSPILLDAMETDENPFNLSALGEENVTLFLVLPVDRLQTHARWLRLILTGAIRAIIQRETPPALPVLFMVDEMGTIGRLAMIEQAYGLMAGSGIRLWGFLQNLPQLKGDYPATWETFLSNSDVLQVLKARDMTTTGYFSKYLGETEVWVTSKERNSVLSELQREPKLEPKDPKAYQDWALKWRERKLWKTLEITRLVNLEFENYMKIHPDKRRGIPFSRLCREGDLERTIFHPEEHYSGEWYYTTHVVPPDYNEPQILLHKKPVMLPQDVRAVPDDQVLTIVSGRGAYVLPRLIYFREPGWKGHYRHNPYFPVVSDQENSQVAGKIVPVEVVTEAKVPTGSITASRQTHGAKSFFSRLFT